MTNDKTIPEGRVQHFANWMKANHPYEHFLAENKQLRYIKIRKFIKSYNAEQEVLRNGKVKN